MLLRKSTHKNLFGKYPRYQIDGNFACTAGIAEMLLQSHEDGIHLLPAIPAAWTTGYVKGLRARGGFEVDIEWEDGELKEASIKSHSENLLVSLLVFTNNILADEVIDEREIPSLYEVFSEYFTIGAGVHPGRIDSKKDLILKHFNSLTATNQMKPDALQSREGDFNFGSADYIVDFAVENDMKVRGHTLVWHNQTPSWFFEDENGNRIDQKEEITEEERQMVIGRMENHINEVVGKYKGIVYAWDVVNEAIDGGTYRDSPWLTIIGEEYIAKAFEFAHAADPDAKLFYNDYNATDPGKRDTIIEMLESLIEDGVPIHGMGLQGHWNIHGPSIFRIRTAIDMYSSLGLEIQITELDISMFEWGDNRKLEEPTRRMLNMQRDRYKEIFELFREYSSVITNVTFWGVADTSTWLDNFPVEGRKEWPFLFDVNGEPKDSFWEVIDF
ncbi:endo-1,4-beta-xylanase [Halanaerobiaceae bacterium ANBcell28]